MPPKSPRSLPRRLLYPALILTCLALPAQAAGDAKALVTKFYTEVINQNHLDQADQYFAKDAIEHEPMNHPEMAVSEQFKLSFQALRKGFPDLNFKIDDILLEGDKVVVRFRMQGTHTGEFMTHAATGKHIDIPGLDIIRIADGKFVEHWGYMDSMLLRVQLGLVD